LGIKIGVIGGSGFYSLFEKGEKIKISTPFGDVTLTHGKIENKNVYFLPRHGEKHSVPPHKINYRANAFAFFLLGVDYVISTSAVGSLRREIKPGDIVVVNQIIDFTKTRPTTFFDGKFEVRMRDGRIKKGVIHTDVTNPYCEKLRRIIIDVLKEKNLRFHEKGTYVCTEGPRFETPAEINFFRMIGGDVVGMTNAPEVFLFKELEICYATICIVTNYAAGMQEKVTHEEVIELFNKNLPKILDVIKTVIKRI